LFAGGDEFVQMLDAEPDVLADPGAADLALSDRISDPACRPLRYVAASSTVKSGRCWSGVRGSPPTGSWLELILLKDTAITHGGLNALGIRGYVDLQGVKSLQPGRTSHRSILGGTVRVT